MYHEIGNYDTVSRLIRPYESLTVAQRVFSVMIATSSLLRCSVTQFVTSEFG